LDLYTVSWFYAAVNFTLQISELEKWAHVTNTGITNNTESIKSFSFSPTYALMYIIKILSQAVTLIAHFTPTRFDPYGSSSGSTAGPC